jgi:hypothetical protein
LLGACGSKSASSTATATRNLAGIASGRMEVWKCFRAHGIDIPDLKAVSGRVERGLRLLANFPRARVESATVACASAVRQGFPGGSGANLTPSQLALRQQELLSYAVCMRSQGIQFPEPPLRFGQTMLYLSAIVSQVGRPGYRTAANTCGARSRGGSGG